jgi:hypothetical protein
LSATLRLEMIDIFIKLDNLKQIYKKWNYRYNS